MKTLTEKDIKNTIIELIEKNGETSNKEVKEKLRDDGFWVTQSTVKNFVDSNFKALGLKCNPSGHYKIYTFENDVFEVDVNFSSRQLRFTKDSNTELFSKLKNPKYIKFTNRIKLILEKRNAI